MRYVILLAAVLFSADASSNSWDAMSVAEGIGSVIEAEKMCDLSYDQPAIKKFVEANVDGDNLRFMRWMKRGADDAKQASSAMSLSQKTAYCAQVAQIATTYGFIKP